MSFAKLFESEKYGQILVKLDEEETGYEVRFYVEPEGYGVCSLAATFGKSEASARAAKQAFDVVDSDFAEIMAQQVCDSSLGVSGGLRALYERVTL